ncbi:MAG: metallophosphoesterase family protein [Anaerolineales bacterium]
MRLAVLADIHGNLAALEAVLADLEAQPTVDHIWVLGDLALFGPQPGACVDAVRKLQEEREAKVIQGNTDRYIVTGAAPIISAFEADDWETQRTALALRDASINWARERLDGEQATYLYKLGHSLSLEAEGFGWISAFHAIPGDDEGIVTPDTDEFDLRDALLDAESRLLFGGHTHLAMDRDLGDMRMVNPGSVGLPFDGDTRAAYAILTQADDAPLHIDLRRVAYDMQPTLDALAEHPKGEAVRQQLRDASA